MASTADMLLEDARADLVAALRRGLPGWSWGVELADDGGEPYLVAQRGSVSLSLELLSPRAVAVVVLLDGHHALAGANVDTVQANQLPVVLLEVLPPLLASVHRALSDAARDVEHGGFAPIPF